MKGLLTKDFLTIKKKYGLPRVIMDIAIIIALMFILEKSGTIYISFLLIPIEIMSMIISLTTCDEQWKWGKYAVSLPVSKKQIVCSRYACAGILSLIGFVVALIVNSASYILFPQYAYGIVLSSDENKLFGGRIGKPKVAICPECGEVSIYLEDLDRLN